uniref:(California timema) hypothetical protein n=1 Tax=Timema californicum TaxID=61474 RepID=A0A7R9J8J7_TIMCA|nr:unnamed protein product [Timema californicum]
MKASVFVVLVFCFVSVTKKTSEPNTSPNCPVLAAQFGVRLAVWFAIPLIEECTEAVPATMTDQCKVQDDGSVNQQYLIDIVTEKIGKISEDQETVMRFMFSSCEEKIKEKSGCIRDFKSLHCAWGDEGWPGVSTE